MPYLRLIGSYVACMTPPNATEAEQSKCAAAAAAASITEDRRAAADGIKLAHMSRINAWKIIWSQLKTNNV